MTDEELIELVQAKPPEELTLGELQLLKQGLARSPALREALAAQLQVEQSLGAVLGGPSLSAERILRRACRLGRLTVRRLSMALVALLVLADAIFLALAMQRPRTAPRDRETVQRTPDAHGRRPDKRATPPPSPVEQPIGAAANQADPTTTQATTSGATAAGNATPPDPTAAKAVDQAQAPWAHVLQSGQPPPFAEVCFQDFPAEQTGMSQAQLEQWLQPIDPPRLRRTDRQRRAPLVEGLVKLRAPWPAETALRLAVDVQGTFWIHVLSASSSVSLRLDSAEMRWTGYRSAGSGSSPRPKPTALVGTDGDRYRRTAAGTFEMHYQAGLVVLTRGDVWLLTAPLAGPPREVLFDGRAAWRGIELFAVSGLPQAPSPRPLVVEIDRPAEREWKTELAQGAQLVPQGDGGVQMISPATEQESRAALAVEPGLCEAIFEIEHARPGSGIFLADAQLRPSHRVGFFRDHRSGQTVLGYAGPGERRDAADYDENRQAVPLAGERTWLKLIAGVGKFECQVSGDGRHWGRLPEAPLRNMPPGFAAVGLYCLPGSKERAITLRRIELRELSALTGLAPAGVRQRAPPLHDIPEIGAWLQAVAESQPEDVAPAVWRRACAVRTLSGAPPIPLANALLHGLVREGLRLPLEPPQHLALLDEAALLADTWDQRESLRFEQYYAELAQVLRGRGKDSVWPMLETAFIESPLWSQDGQLALPESILRQEMLEAVYAQEWDRIAAMYRRLKHWDTTVEPERRPRWRREVQVVRELSDWGAAQAARELPRDVDRSRLPITAEGRHPLVEQVSKEGFSVLAELEATLRTGSYADAGQILSSIDPRQSAGLLPDSRDTRLLMGLREAIALAAMEHPAWQQMLREQFAPLGRLRVRQAIADGDADRVQAAALQFFGTDAAAEAERWLGERALLRGEFLAAVSHFEKALVDAPATWAADASARLRLAGAMLGQDRGASPVSPFELGGTHISPEEFERLVAELRAAHGGELGSLAQTDKAAVPAPTRFEVRRLGEFAHDAIADAGGGPRTFDWLGRRMGTATAGDLLIVSDGANLATYDLVSGQRRWLLPAVGGISLQRWASTAARPVVAGDKVFARRLSGSGPEVVCVSLQRGNVLWTWTSSGGPCSDALVVQGKVYVLTVSSQPDRLVQVGLQVLSASDGSAQGDFPLFQLRDYFNGYLPLLAALVGERIVAVGGGCVFACDLQGKLLWLRRQEWIPPALDTNGELQHAATLVPHGQQLIVTQAGARAAECLDSASGRLVWRYVEAELGGVRGCCQGVVLVETDRGWVGLDAKTGAVRWRRPVIALCEGVLCGTPGGFAYARRELIDGQAWRPVIEWMDPQTGQRRGRAPLPALRSSWAQLGPLVAHPRGLWAFHLREYGERNRALVALAPQGDPLEAGDSDRELLNWLTDPVREMHGEVAAVLPGWTLVAAGTDQRTGLFSQLANETDVLVTQATFLDRARLLRRLELPAGARAKLSIRVGHNGQSPWNLEVRAGGRLLLLEEVSPKTAPDGWLTRELDLAALSGTGAWLAVTHRSTSDQTSYAHWKKLEVRAAE